MKQKQKANVKQKFVNFIGSVGYFFCFLQWFWVVMLYFSVFQSIPLIQTEPNKGSYQFHIPAPTLPSPIQTTIIAIVVGAMILTTIYILIKIPVTIARTGRTIVHKSAETIVPAVAKAQHRPATKTFRIKLTPKLAVIIKSLLVAIPILLTVSSGLLEDQSISFPVATAVGGGLAVLGLGSFALQYIFALIFRVKPRNLW